MHNMIEKLTLSPFGIKCMIRPGILKRLCGGKRSSMSLVRLSRKEINFLKYGVFCGISSLLCSNWLFLSSRSLFLHDFLNSFHTRIFGNFTRASNSRNSYRLQVTKWGSNNYERMSIVHQMMVQNHFVQPIACSQYFKILSFHPEISG